jgi:photosystem II stability/assembly factor-like uncharacterized protein
MNQLTKKSIFFLFSFLLISLFESATIAQTTIKGDALFGSMRARHLGPALMSGRVTDMESHPTDSKIIYTGTAGGGVWKSVDGGVTFNSIFDDYCQSIGVVSLDPSDPDNTIWVGTGEVWTRNSVSIGDGIFKSNDGGKSWKKMGLDKSDRISSIQINPNNSNEIYVGVVGALWGDSEERGVYKTQDGGETWEKIFYINESTGCSELVIDPSNPNTLYAAMWEFRRTAYSFNSGGDNSALYKSTDGGANWRKIHNGYPSGSLGRIAVAMAPSETNILYSVIEAEDKDKGGMYRSTDGGESWTQKNSDFELTVRPFYFSKLAVHPSNPDMVAKAGYFGAISEDAGETIRPIGSGVHPDIHDFSFDPNDSNRMYLGCDGGVYRSYDGGTVWEMVKGLPLSQFYHVTVDNETPFNVYGGLQDNGSWIGPSASNAGIEAGDWKSVGYGDGFRVYPHPTNSNTVYSEMQGAEMIWKVDVEKVQSRTIQPFAEEGDPKLRFNWNTPITTSLHHPDRLYVGSQFVHKSDDQGQSWQKISGDLTTNDPSKQQQEDSGGLSKDNSGAENHCTVFTIAESPINDQTIWVGTDDGNVQLTKNGGSSWTDLTGNIPDLPKNTWCYHIEASVHDINTAYAVFDGHTQNDMNPYVYKTTDAGASWTSITTDDIEVFARSIQEDFVNPNLLYLGTEFGLYVTIDGGKNWSKFTNNMPSVAVHHVTLHPRDHSLVMGTHGRGVIIIDDVRPLRQLTTEVMDETVHFFDLGPHVMKENGNGGGSMIGGFGGTATYGEFVGQNPNSMAQIVYFMKKRHTFGKMKLQLYDDQGNHIVDLPAGKQKGINSVQWNMRTERPQLAAAKTISRGGFSSPLAAPGVYTVKLTKGKEVYESTIELQYDPESIYSDQDRDIAFEKTQKLFHMNEDLAYLIGKADAIYAAAKEQESASDSKLKSLSQELMKSIDAYKLDKVITTGDNYVGAAEPQLRENMADLFSEVSGQIGPPSAAQLNNLVLLEKGLSKAHEEFKAIDKTFQKWNKLMSKQGFEEMVLKTKEEFLSED